MFNSCQESRREEAKKFHRYFPPKLSCIPRDREKSRGFFPQVVRDVPDAAPNALNWQRSSFFATHLMMTYADLMLIATVGNYLEVLEEFLFR